MKEDFKKWLCELAEYGYKPHKLSWQLTYNMNRLEILIKAMWAINKRTMDFDMRIIMDEDSIVIFGLEGVPYTPASMFYYVEYNSEQEALTKALEYIYKKDKP